MENPRELDVLEERLREKAWEKSGADQLQETGILLSIIPQDRSTDAMIGFNVEQVDQQDLGLDVATSVKAEPVVIQDGLGSIHAPVPVDDQAMVSAEVDAPEQQEDQTMQDETEQKEVAEQKPPE